MSLAEALKMQSVAYALQAQLGSRPDQIKISLFGEGGTAKVLVSGLGRHQMESFRQQVAQESNETIVELVQRAVVIGMSHIDPYITALSEVRTNADEKDFNHAETIIKFAMAALPPSPINYQRSLFENLNGIISLFKGDAKAAHDWFARARDSSPTGTVADVVASLNEAFADLQLDNDQEATEHVETLLREEPPTDKVLLCTTYMTLAAARLGVHDINGADAAIAKAVGAYPDASSAYDLWADIKREKGDPQAAARMHRKALENSVKFENYSEVATLYFRLAWRDNQPMMRSPYSNPDIVGLHATPHP
jgi:tetratricopeptide (TPR) repeat protein